MKIAPVYLSNLDGISVPTKWLSLCDARASMNRCDTRLKARLYIQEP
jgi:hypothetical protein